MRGVLGLRSIFLGQIKLFSGLSHIWCHGWPRVYGFCLRFSFSFRCWSSFNLLLWLLFWLLFWLRFGFLFCFLLRFLLRFLLGLDLGLGLWLSLRLSISWLHFDRLCFDWLGFVGLGFCRFCLFLLNFLLLLFRSLLLLNFRLVLLLLLSFCLRALSLLLCFLICETLSSGCSFLFLSSSPSSLRFFLPLLLPGPLLFPFDLVLCFLLSKLLL